MDDVTTNDQVEGGENSNDNIQKDESVSGDVYTSGEVRTESYPEPQPVATQPEVAKPVDTIPTYPTQNLTQPSKKKTDLIYKLGIGLMVVSIVVAGVVYYLT